MQLSKQERLEWIDKRIDFLLSELGHNDKLTDEDIKSLNQEIEKLTHQLYITRRV